MQGLLQKHLTKQNRPRGFSALLHSHSQHPGREMKMCFVSYNNITTTFDYFALV